MKILHHLWVLEEEEQGLGDGWKGLHLYSSITEMNRIYAIILTRFFKAYVHVIRIIFPVKNALLEV